MKLSELIEQLSEIADSIPGDPYVEIAIQPAWPLAGEIEAFTLDPENRRLWLAVSEADGYAPKSAWDGGVIVH